MGEYNIIIKIVDDGFPVKFSEYNLMVHVLQQIIVGKNETNINETLENI